MQDVLKKKYQLTDQELKSGIDIIAKNVSKICDVNVAIAICDLLANGDIPEKSAKEK